MNQQNTKDLINQSWLKRKQAAIPGAIKPQYELFISKAKNSEIWDKEGNKYIDFSGGIATMNVGHSHPAVLKAVTEQIQKFQHTCFVVVPYSNYIELAEVMNTLVPGNFSKKTFFINSGVEAVENAIKLARYYTKRRGIIAFQGAFHGRTYLGMSLTGKVMPYKHGFGAGDQNIYHAPFPNKLAGVSTKDSLKAIEQIFKSEIDASSVAAIVVEPVQGEGGFYIAPKDFIQGLRKICDEYGILLVLDEIQTGFGRTGKFMAIEHYTDENGKVIDFDILTFAKSVAAGFPLSGVTAKTEIFDSVHVGGFGSTYGGHPVSIAAALAVIDVINQEKLLERSEELGKKLVDELSKIDSPIIAEVRGLGSMVAIEFQSNLSNITAAEIAKAIQKSALNKGLMILTCGVNYNIVRCLYPLTIEDKLFDEAIHILKSAINEPLFERN